MTGDRIRIATFNLKDGGGSIEGRSAALRMLAELEIDALLMQELADDDEQLADAQKILGMVGTVAGGNRGKLHTAVFLRKDTFPGFRAFKAEKLGRIRPCDVTTHLPGHKDVPFTFVSVHSSYNSPIDRLREAYGLVPVADKAQAGQPVFIGGDWNELPMPDGEVVDAVEYATVDDRVHCAYRARQVGVDTWEPITEVDRLMHNLGFSDAAKHVARRDGKSAALEATAGHEQPAQGGRVRLDRILVPQWMVDVVEDAKVLDTGHSDHRLVLVEVSRPGLTGLLDRRRDLSG